MQTKRQAGKSCAAAQAASVDVTADVELHDPDSEQGDDTTQHNNQDPNEHIQSCHDAGSNSCFDEISGDNPEDELELWADIIKRGPQSGRLASSKQNHVVDSQAEPDLLKARMIAKHHGDRWTKLISNWTPAISTKQKGDWKQGGPAKRWEDDLDTYLQPDRTNRDNSDLTSDIAEDNSKWDAIDSDFISDKQRTGLKPTTSTRRHQRRRRRHAACLLSTRWWSNLRNTKATKARTLVQKTATTFLPPPKHSGLGASQRSVAGSPCTSDHCHCHRGERAERRARRDEMRDERTDEIRDERGHDTRKGSILIDSPNFFAAV